MCLLDSGADISLLLSQYVVGTRLNSSQTERIRAANNTEIETEGQICLPVTVGRQSLSATFTVSPNVDEVCRVPSGVRRNCVIRNLW